MKTCLECDSTDLVKGNSKLCKKHYRAYMKQWHKKRDIDGDLEKIRQNIDKFYEEGREWLSKKSRNFLLDNNKNMYGSKNFNIVDHTKFVGNVVVIHSQHKKKGE